MSLPKSTQVLVAGFVGSGLVHVVRPATFMPAMPAWVPAHREVVVGSGVAELVCAAGLVWPRTRDVAALASAALLVGVLPGNVQMAQDALASRSTPRKAAMLARLPLQWPMIRAALAARGTA